ncbi:MAG: discoidin domain-containing protein [Candidatus Gorgyraea atricola]|nr:discoidin domain-containing protein [Candidatus Gorgyraea atricola]
MINKRGFALLLVFAVLVALSSILFAFLAMVSGEMRNVSAGLQNIQAFYIAEAGRAKARWALTTDEQSVGWGETNNDPFGIGIGAYVVTTEYSDAPTNEQVTITSKGYVPDSSNPSAKRQVIESDIPAAATSTGSNLSLGATASASSEGGKDPASDAIDGDSKSKWKADDSGDAWLKLDFGSSTTFNQVVINGQNKIDSATFYHSADDSGYSAVTNMTEDPTWTFTFDEVSDRYLRTNIVATTGKKGKADTPEVDELETYGSSGGLGRGEFSTSW